MRLESVRRTFRLLIDGKTHRFGPDDKTVCGLPTDYATEAPLQTRWCPECRIGAVEALETKLQAALLRAELAEEKARQALAAAQAAEATLAAKQRAQEAAKVRADAASKATRQTMRKLAKEGAALAEAARMWRAISEGEAVSGNGSDEDYLLTRPVQEPRFAK